MTWEELIELVRHHSELLIGVSGLKVATDVFVHMFNNAKARAEFGESLLDWSVEHEPWFPPGLVVLVDADGMRIHVTKEGWEVTT